MPGAMIFTINPPSLGQSPFKSPVRLVISGTIMIKLESGRDYQKYISRCRTQKC